MGESVDCCVITMTVCGLFDYIHYRMIKWLTLHNDKVIE